MVVLKRRSRMVTFRVSAEEYDDLTKACLVSGARSISEFARTASLHKVHTERTSSGTLSGDLSTLSTALAELDASLTEIRRRIRGVLGPVISEREDTSTSRA